MTATFSLFLPPGWTRIDLSGDLAMAVDDFAGKVARKAPYTRQPTVRRLVADQLTQAVTEFAARGVACLVVSTASAVEEPVRPLATFTPLAAVDDVDPMIVLQAVSDSDAANSELLEMDGLLGIKTVGSADATDAARGVQPVLDQIIADPTVIKVTIPPELRSVRDDVAIVSSRVRYTFGDPTDRTRWMDVQLAVDHPSIPEAQALAEAQIDLFDAVISTFRWTS